MSLTPPIGVVVTIISMVLSGGIAWGVSATRIATMEKNMERVERHLERTQQELAMTNRWLERLDERLASIQRAQNNTR